ncbi:MAG: M24 family metallopeptidase [Gammaproteobacteria bacterium]|jgi:Xaa-Pro aminopeptidase|nr:M24 family metallopeptidase [Gammaproteobacteria bacterium]MBT4494066.1 M24 family metallopeptidase [Gammaproteobacteria bacterium]MBT7371422.1 M24 family metallopeptidase [Gammaproteobacteria bacterium]
MAKKRARKKIGLTEFVRRRRELMALMEDDSIAILPGALARFRNSDVEFRFRQDSDFHYLTGFDEPDAVFVLVPGREHGEAILFCRERDDQHEQWHGDVTGPERAMQLYGMDDAFPITDIDDILPGLIEGRSHLYYAMGADRDFDSQVIDWVRMIRSNGQPGTEPPGEFIQLEQYLHELRLFKSAAEIELMRRAAEATVRGHIRILKNVEPGMLEYELEAELYHEFVMAGARWPAYPAIVGGGKNACTFHYICNDDVLCDGDLVLVDAGGEYENYACDLTRTFPVSGRFTKAQVAVYEVVLKAQQAAIDAVKPGNTWNEPHDAAIREVTLGLVDLGILKGDIDNLLKSEAYLPYCPHKTGHWLGLDVHDVGDYRVNGQWRVFEEGMVTTIEPGIYFGVDQDDVPADYRGIGIRIEDDILVTRTGNEVLTAAVPKAIGEIEALMGGGGH